MRKRLTTEPNACALSSSSDFDLPAADETVVAAFLDCFDNCASRLCVPDHAAGRQDRGHATATGADHRLDHDGGAPPVGLAVHQGSVGVRPRDDEDAGRRDAVALPVARQLPPKESQIEGRASLLPIFEARRKAETSSKTGSMETAPLDALERNHERTSRINGCLFQRQDRSGARGGDPFRDLVFDITRSFNGHIFKIKACFIARSTTRGSIATSSPRR